MSPLANQIPVEIVERVCFHIICPWGQAVFQRVTESEWIQKIWKHSVPFFPQQTSNISATLVLARPIKGPKTIVLDLEMVTVNNVINFRGSSIISLTIFVSEHPFWGYTNEPLTSHLFMVPYLYLGLPVTALPIRQLHFFILFVLWIWTLMWSSPSLSAL